MRVDDYEKSVAEFYRDAEHLTLKRPYSDAIYQPMVELLRYLEEHGFTATSCRAAIATSCAR